MSEHETVDEFSARFHKGCQAEIASLQQRIEALAAYTVHKYECATQGTARDPMHAYQIINAGPCDCGLEAALRGGETG